MARVKSLLCKREMTGRLSLVKIVDETDSFWIMETREKVHKNNLRKFNQSIYDKSSYHVITDKIKEEYNKQKIVSRLERVKWGTIGYKKLLSIYCTLKGKNAL